MPGTGDRMKRVWVLLVVLAACAPPLEEPAEPGVEEVGDAVDTEEDEGSGVDLILGPCGGDEVQDLVGTALTDAGDRIPEDARRIAPGDVVTIVPNA